MLFALSMAFAGVHVTDPSSCLVEETTWLEINSALGDQLFAQLSIFIELQPVGDELQVQLRVDESSKDIWYKSFSVTRQECSDLPQTIALSVERGLMKLPRFRAGRRQRRELMFGPQIGSSLGVLGERESRVTLGLGGLFDVTGSLGATLSADLIRSSGVPLAPGRGALVGLLASAGVGPWIGRAQAQVGFTAGTVFIYGRGFPADRGVWRPWLASNFRAAFQFSALQPAITAHVPLTRVVWVGPNESKPESSIRLGVEVALRFPVKSQGR